MPLSQPIDMETFENTVHSWFTTATGLTAIWTNQSAPQPAKPYATLQVIAGPTQLSQHWETRTNYDVGRDPGEEVELETGVPCRITVACQVLVGQPAARQATTNARAYMLAASAALSKQSVLDLFAAEEIAIERVESPLDIPAIVGAEFDARSSMDVIFGAALNVSEFTGYMDKVELKSPALGIDIIIED